MSWEELTVGDVIQHRPDSSFDSINPPVYLLYRYDPDWHDRGAWLALGTDGQQDHIWREVYERGYSLQRPVQGQHKSPTTRWIRALRGRR